MWLEGGGLEQGGVAEERTPMWKAVVVVKAKRANLGGTGVSCATDSPTRASHLSRFCHILWPPSRWRCLSHTRSAQASALRPQATSYSSGSIPAGRLRPAHRTPAWRFPELVVGHKGMRSGAWLVRL